MAGTMKMGTAALSGIALFAAGNFFLLTNGGRKLARQVRQWAELAVLPRYVINNGGIKVVISPLGATITHLYVPDFEGKVEAGLSMSQTTAQPPMDSI